MMRVFHNERQNAFSIWIRTGRNVFAPVNGDIEHKYNHWHDPENGRFTFSGTGRYIQRRNSERFAGRGGAFGGGGATGTWDTPAPKPQPSRRGIPRTNSQRTADVPTSARTQTVPAPEFRRIVRNGYVYEIDTNQRTRRVSGTLQRGNVQARSRAVQMRAGGEDRRSSDDGGHFIARRFKGATEAFNHFAQNANFNRGRYRVLEDQWARAQKDGKSVYVRIVPVYQQGSKRPSALNIWFYIDGILHSQQIPNERQENANGRR